MNDNDENQKGDDEKEMRQGNVEKEIMVNGNDNKNDDKDLPLRPVQFVQHSMATENPTTASCDNNLCAVERPKL